MEVNKDCFASLMYLDLTGRTLFLVTDPNRMTAQLQGVRVPHTDLQGGAITLRDDVSTDEITPAAAYTKAIALFGL